MIKFNTQFISKAAHPVGHWCVRVVLSGSVSRRGMNLLSINGGRQPKGPP